MSALPHPAPAHQHPPSCLPGQPRPPRSPLQLPLAPGSGLALGRASFACKATGTRQKQSPGLAISIQEVETALRARSAETPAWAQKETAKARRSAKAAAPPAALSRPKLKRLTALAATPRAAALGLTSELCVAKFQELRLLLPGVSESQLSSLEDERLLDLMADTPALATRLVELRAKLVPGGRQQALPSFLRNNLQHLCTSSSASAGSGCPGSSFLPWATLQGHTAAVTAVATSPDGRRALSGSKDGSLRLWDLPAQTCTATLPGHTASVSAVAVAADGRRAVSSSWDKTLRVWDLDSPAAGPVATLTGHTNKVAALALTPDGQRAVSGGYDRTVRVWDLQAGRCTAELRGHGATVGTVAVTADCRCAVSGGYDMELRVWDLRGGACSSVVRVAAQQGLGAVAVFDDGTQAVAALGSVLYVWDLQSWIARAVHRHRGAVRAVALAAGGRLAVSGGEDARVRVWGLDAGECVAVLRGHARGVAAVAVTPDGRWAVSGGRDQALCLWDLAPHLAAAAAGPGSGASSSSGADDED